MSQAQLPVESFLENFHEALGAYKGVDLRLLTSVDRQAKGKAWIKSYRAKIAYDSDKGVYLEQKPKTLNKGTLIDRRMWENNTDLQTFANELARRTPHQDIDYYMSAIEPKISETGHEFETLDEIEEANDPASQTMKILANSFQLDRNQKVLDAVLATSVSRKKLCLTKGNANFGKVVTADEAWATNAPHNTLTTANVGYFSLKQDAPRLRAMADCANVPDKEHLIMLINPNDAAEMCVNSFDQMYSIDFVDKKHLTEGTLPEAFGISFVKCPLVKKGQMVAWLKEALAWVPWHEFDATLANNIDRRNHPQFYAWESNNFVRLDDLGVFVVNVKTATQNASGEGGGSGSGS